MVKHYLMDRDYFSEIGMAPVYALEGCPGWPSRAILVAAQDTWKGIEDGALVAYRDDQDVVQVVGNIGFTEDNIILQSLPSGLPDKVLPRDEIRRCDRIRTVDFSDNALTLQKAELKMFLKNSLGI